MVRRAVGPGSKAAKLAETIELKYSKGNGYVEVSADLCGSATARRILSVVRSGTSGLVLDLALVVEGTTEAELPERVLGAARLHRVDPDLAEPLSCLCVKIFSSALMASSARMPVEAETQCRRRQAGRLALEPPRAACNALNARKMILTNTRRLRRAWHVRLCPLQDALLWACLPKAALGRGRAQQILAIKKGGGAEQYNADKKFKEAVAVAVEPRVRPRHEGAGRATSARRPSIRAREKASCADARAEIAGVAGHESRTCRV